MDLAKAFDSVHIPKLIDKMEAVGIRGKSLDIFRDYLSNRRQCVAMGKSISKDLPIKFGVPQGSILGPTLFLIYINDLCQLAIPKTKIITYADDTVLLVAEKSWKEAFFSAQTGLDIVINWLKQNILTLNVDKTKYITHSIRASGQPPNELRLIAHECPIPLGVMCSCKSIDKTDTMRYLGVTIDSQLNFSAHIEGLTGRVRKLIYIFKNVRHVADISLVKRIYFALCQSLISYCISAWGGAPKTTLIHLERAQRFVLKVMHSLPFLTPTEYLYKTAKVLSVRQLFILSAALKYHSTLDYNRQHVRNNCRRAFYVGKRSKKFNTAFSRKFFDFNGPYIYNKLNKTLNIYDKTKRECKNIVTDWLLHQNYENTEDIMNIIT